MPYLSRDEVSQLQELLHHAIEELTPAVSQERDSTPSTEHVKALLTEALGVVTVVGHRPWTREDARSPNDG